MQATTVNEGIRLTNVSGDMTAETTNGDIVIENAQTTSLEASTVNGDLTFNGTIRDGGAYRLTTHGGDIRVGLGGAPNATVFVRTFQGDFGADFPIQLPEGQSARSGSKRFNFTLGTGSARIELQSFNGDIVVARKSMTSAEEARRIRRGQVPQPPPRRPSRRHHRRRRSRPSRRRIDFAFNCPTTRSSSISMRCSTTRSRSRSTVHSRSAFDGAFEHAFDGAFEFELPDPHPVPTPLPAPPVGAATGADAVARGPRRIEATRREVREVRQLRWLQVRRFAPAGKAVRRPFVSLNHPQRAERANLQRGTATRTCEPCGVRALLATCDGMIRA